jgi:hypothetical protein
MSAPSVPPSVIEASKSGGVCAKHPERKAFAWCATCAGLKCLACAPGGMCLRCRVPIRSLGSIALATQGEPVNENLPHKTAKGDALAIPLNGHLPMTTLSSLHVESDHAPSTGAARVRVVRVLVYEGERDHVVRTLEKSLYGQCVISRTLTIKATDVEGEEVEALMRGTDFGPQVFAFGYQPKGGQQ